MMWQKNYHKIIWFIIRLLTRGKYEKIQQVIELRDAGKKAHEEGDHAKSEELLIKALNLFKS